VNPDIFSEWLTRQGYRVIRSQSSYWYDAGPRVLQAFPYHWLIQPDEEEVRSLLVGQGNLALRYSCPLGSSRGMVSYHVVLQPPYTMDLLRSQARNGVRRGMDHCHVEQIAFERLATEGWVLQKDTLQRQNRSKSMRQEDWDRICRAANGLPGFEAWSAIVEEKLAACLLIARIGDTFCVPFAICDHKYLNMHVNNVLFFNVSCDLLSRVGVKEIFYSLHSLDAPESVNEFKFRMGFEARPVCQRVVLHPLLRPLANRATHSFSQKLLKLNPEMPFISKMEGMLRFHQIGKSPIDQQPWPDCIADQKPIPSESQTSTMGEPMAAVVEGIE
jgi:hypothetical protein